MQHGDVTREISVAASATASGPARTVSGTFESSGASQITPGSVLSSRYEILHLLGQGGMGAVYKARDRELNRLVALKVIRPELACAPDLLERFKQELILARQVTHKNVIRIYDLGRSEERRVGKECSAEC